MLEFDINLVFTIINILILFVIFKMFLFKPVKDIIAKRQELIQISVDSARETELAMQKMKSEYEASMKDIEEEKERAISEARADAAAKSDKLIEAARKQSDSMILNAREKAENERKLILKQAREQVSELVFEASSKLSAAKHDEAADLALYDQFINEAGE